MTKKEFESLRYGSVITQNKRFYMVFSNSELGDGFIDTQDLSEIGDRNEFGFTHSNINYKYADVVTDENILKAILKWFNLRELEEETDIEPYSFITGYCKALEDNK